MIVWLNGRLVGEEDAHIAADDRGFLLGDGVFETILSLDGHMIDLDAHLDRLRQSAYFLGISPPFREQTIKSAAHALLEGNALGGGRASLRITLSLGPGHRGLLPPASPKPNLLITAAAAPEPPLSLKAITATVRRNEGSPLCQIKSLNYLDNIIARREALKVAADDALLYNNKGHLACASAANVYLVEEGAIVTPPLSDGALPGIVRQRLLQLASAHNFTIEETSLSVERVSAAHEIFVTNSLMGVCPVHELDGRALPSMKRAAALGELYWQALGNESANL